MHKEFYIGLMSGTSLDGVDASLIETDGAEYFKPVADFHLPYNQAFKNDLRQLLDRQYDFHEIERELTKLHAIATNELLEVAKFKSENVKAIGFHGQALYHAPNKKITWQIGNPHLLVQHTGINVVHDFRRGDVELGGQGAPLVPIFHKCIMQDENSPIAVINIGGVANITYIDSLAGMLIAFDTGTGNALIDDAMAEFFKLPFEKNGDVAGKGVIDHKFINKVLELKYFTAPYPKSLDRNQFTNLLETLKKSENNPNNIIATLTFLTANTIFTGIKILPKIPSKIFLCGGGSKNLTMIKWLNQLILQENMSIEILNVAEKGNLSADYIESQAFALLNHNIIPNTIWFFWFAFSIIQIMT